MTITLDLEPDQIEALTHHPTAKNDEVETALYQLIASQAPKSTMPEPVVLSAKQQAMIDLFDTWRAEDAAMTPEERAQSDAEYEEFKANINKWRAEEGRVPAFL